LHVDPSEGPTLSRNVRASWLSFAADNDTSEDSRMMSKNKTQVETKERVLTAAEEKVVRMRHGLRAPDSLVLEQLGQDHPETAAKLAEIEQRALAAVGARSNPSKDRIVKALRSARRRN
jgi:DNA-directed RNA polymerase sigma subunit (sigma70/sigma32)